MIAFEVIVNGSKLCDAGIEGLGVLSAILSWAHRVPEPEAESNESHAPDELLLEVGGLKSARDYQPGEQMSWLSKHLQVGDAIVINIKNLEIVDPPEKLVPEDPGQVVRAAKRRYFEELKKEFGDGETCGSPQTVRDSAGGVEERRELRRREDPEEGSLKRALTPADGAKKNHPFRKR